MNEIKANNILELVKEHKKSCKGETCSISTYYLLEDFERHMGRKATQEEYGVFV